MEQEESPLRKEAVSPRPEVPLQKEATPGFLRLHRLRSSSSSNATTATTTIEAAEVINSAQQQQPQKQQHRRLFDNDFLLSNCSPDKFKASTNVDDTFWTYSTNYLIAWIGLYYAWRLVFMVKKIKRKRRSSYSTNATSSTLSSTSASSQSDSNHNNNNNNNKVNAGKNLPIITLLVLPRKHYLFSGGFLLFHSLCHIIAGAGHQMTKEKGQLLWGAHQLGLLVIGLSGICLVEAGGMELWHYHANGNGNRNVPPPPQWLILLEIFWLVSSSIGVCAGAIFKSSLVASVLVGVGIILVKACILLHYWQTRQHKRKTQKQKQLYQKEHRLIYQYQLGAVFCYLFGFAIQYGWKGVCGSGGYQDCFVNCPLPAPTFNHNALFHILAAISIYLYGKSKIAQLKLLSVTGAGSTAATIAKQ
eukprot:CAMPEP_0198137768 /NCGR_PEP_ID=MMETSP1443-20131203/1225_1 /TAXON_ID=186043 /ORGANISM="Entomoneis sp., Strain CCMP2396" /LENGTH=416 /DNA_ID=CAMNT_0043799305 /DNA_START=201 /DNA_END=1451 /DNA_ORIENTATION=+